MMKPILSLIVPHRNSIDTLPRLLDSILQQTFRDLEVIVVDDNSAQPVTGIVDAYKNKGLAVRCLENSQRVFTRAARAMGIQAAQGQIIGFADADDILFDDTSVDHHVKIFSEQQPDILHFRFCLIDSQGNFTGFPAPAAEALAPSATGHTIFSLFSARSLYYVVAVWNKYYSKQLCEKILRPLHLDTIQHFGEDLFFNSLCFYHADTYISSQRVGYGYTYEDSQFIQKSYGRSVAYYNVLTFMVNYLTEQGCPMNLLTLYKKAMVQATTIAAGTVCRELYRSQNGLEHDDIVEQFLKYADKDMWLKILILANGYNADKIIRTFKQISQ